MIASWHLIAVTTHRKKWPHVSLNAVRSFTISSTDGGGATLRGLPAPTCAIEPNPKRRETRVSHSDNVVIVAGARARFTATCCRLTLLLTCVRRFHWFSPSRTPYSAQRFVLFTVFEAILSHFRLQSTENAILQWRVRNKYTLLYHLLFFKFLQRSYSSFESHHYHHLSWRINARLYLLDFIFPVLGI